MDTKLTLKLNQKIIEKAKKYAADKKLSLSRIVEFYLQSLTEEDKNEDFEISPFVKSISIGTSIPADFDYKKKYSDYLMEKPPQFSIIERTLSFTKNEAVFFCCTS